MKGGINTVSAKEFLDIADTDIDVWQLCQDQQLVHVDYGEGTITSVKKHGRGILLVIDFEKSESPMELRGELLFKSDKVTEITLPHSLEVIQNLRAFSQETLGISMDRLGEIQNLTEAWKFAELKKKYRVMRYKDPSPESDLYDILLKMEDGRRLRKWERDWLEEYHLQAVIAIDEERRFASTGDAWHAIYASRCWRRAELPEKALAITEDVTSDDDRTMAAILTTRGAAYVDTEDLETGERCVRRAIDLQEDSGKAFAVMARIYSKKGLSSQAGQYYRKARALGAKFEDA